jgi:hypothetical protein
MLCILAFVIFLILFPILGFFPEYRKYFRRAWSCVFKKITLKPCDKLGEELKNKLIGKLFKVSPSFAKFIDKTFAFWAFLFVLLNLWSIGYVAIAGLNLWVHDTCTPSYAEACSLSGDTCSIPVNSMTFDQALSNNQLGDWAAQPFKDLGDTMSKVPDRLKTWNANEYLPPLPTYYSYNDNNSKAVEMIDPSCQYCRKMFQNIKASGFANKYNVTYIAYPIPDNKKPNGYRFAHSYLIATYLEALKIYETQYPTSNTSNNPKMPLDWQLLEKIFTARYKDGNDYQYVFNTVLADKPQEAENLIKELISQSNINNQQIEEVVTISNSQKVKDNLQIHRVIVDKKVRTVKIPTIIFDNRRYDRLLDVEFLKKY